MKRNVSETVLGAVVLGVALIFLVFSYQTADMSRGSDGYELVADFSGIGGLNKGDDVLISGVKVGTVNYVDLDPETYLARVYFSVDRHVKLPDDTAALISSESLLGGRYLQLEPGGSEDMLEPGGRVQYTQAPQNLEQLLGQFIFSMQDSKEKSDEGSAYPDMSSDVPEETEPSESSNESSRNMDTQMKSLSTEQGLLQQPSADKEQAPEEQVPSDPYSGTAEEPAPAPEEDQSAP